MAQGILASFSMEIASIVTTEWAVKVNDKISLRWFGEKMLKSIQMLTLFV